MIILTRQRKPWTLSMNPFLDPKEPLSTRHQQQHGPRHLFPDSKRLHLALLFIAVSLSFDTLIRFFLDDNIPSYRAMYINFNSSNEIFPADPMQSVEQTGNEISIPLYNSSDLFNSTLTDTSLKIDIISIGSMSRSDFQTAQERTFGSHSAIQNFFRITELNDTDQECSSKLKTPQLKVVVRFCNTQFASADLVSNWLRKRLKPFRYSRQSTGWLCAQKRPLDGLHIVLNRYKQNMNDIPDYVAIVDDDSYLNMEPFLTALHAYNNSDRDGLHALSGCVFDMLPNLRFTFPHGGFGSILSRNIILRLLRPIHCSKNHTLLDGYSKMACWRLEQNHLNEKQYFKDGMSVMDLMFTYLKRLSFLNAKRWKDGHGYCLHSDHTLGYFFGFYHVTIPDPILREAELSDDLRRGNLSTYTTLGDVQQCFNENDACSDDDLICHYVKPDQMERMHDAVHIDKDTQAVTLISSEDVSSFAHRNIKPLIDIISIGTLLKPELQNAQQRTFGSHSSIRNFFRITELNDTDVVCSTNLTMAQWLKIYDFCSDLTNQTYISSMLRQRLYKPKNHTGWMCAQKRPLDALYLAVQQYSRTSYETSLPDYLIVADDDTYANMDYLVNNIPTMYPTFEAHIVTGCRLIHPKNIHFSFPFGGFGTIITRKAIENLIQPIYCDSSHGDTGRLATAFNQMACWRLNQNVVGEKIFFQDGMSVLDLMYAYSSGLLFSQVDQWINGVGFCFHSDHALGYFMGFYHIAVPDTRWSAWESDLGNNHQSIDTLFNDSLRVEYGYSNLKRDGVAGCRFRGNRCTAKAPFCHYVQPNQMDDLYAGVRFQ